MNEMLGVPQRGSRVAKEIKSLLDNKEEFILVNSQKIESDVNEALEICFKGPYNSPFTDQNVSLKITFPFK